MPARRWPAVAGERTLEHPEALAALVHVCADLKQARVGLEAIQGAHLLRLEGRDAHLEDLCDVENAIHPMELRFRRSEVKIDPRLQLAGEVGQIEGV